MTPQTENAWTPRDQYHFSVVAELRYVCHWSVYNPRRNLDRDVSLVLLVEILSKTMTQHNRNVLFHYFPEKFTVACFLS